MNLFGLIENAVVGLHGLECSLLTRAYKRACARPNSHTPADLQSANHL